jgi:hypothetical protein
MRFLADARLKQGDAFDLRAFDDYLWKNGNVPIVLLRWEHLGLDDDLQSMDKAETARRREVRLDPNEARGEEVGGK